MPLQKILFKPGVNKENTRYTTEGGWYECDKIRFRQGNPEILGGWQRISSNIQRHLPFALELDNAGQPQPSRRWY